MCGVSVHGPGQGPCCAQRSGATWSRPPCRGRCVSCSARVETQGPRVLPVRLRPAMRVDVSCRGTERDVLILLRPAHDLAPSVFRLRPTAAEERGVWTATRGPRQRGPCRLALMDAWRASRGLPVGPSLSFMTEVAKLGRKPASPPWVAGCATSGSKPAPRARRVCHLRWEHRRSLSWRVEGTGAGLGASHGGRGSGCPRPVWPRLKV